jgi:hypothetical protein
MTTLPSCGYATGYEKHATTQRNGTNRNYGEVEHDCRYGFLRKSLARVIKRSKCFE